jgi:hypothetical protein
MPTFPFRWGEFTETCQLCAEVKTRFGAMVDPNGHIWRICADCINSLWDANQATKVQQRIEDRAEELAMERIRERLFGNE